MKTILTLFLFLMITTTFAQKTDYSSKVSTLDSTIATLYSVISGEKGEARNWELMRFLFHEDAKLIPTGLTKDTTYRAKFMTVEDYIKNSGAWLEKNGFFEKEIHREAEQFGNIAHVFSTYECFKSEKDTKPFMRGINSIQLIYDNKRWWIINIYWAQETPLNPMPRKYITDEKPPVIKSNKAEY